MSHTKCIHITILVYCQVFIVLVSFVVEEAGREAHHMKP